LYIQEQVEKRFEFRVIVIGDETFSFRIDPFQHPIMHIDYRLGGMMVRYEPCAVPTTIQAKLLKLHSAVGLAFGCYDLIEKPSGEFVFLEVNPSGIWALHDEILEGRISDAVASYLCRCLH